ncbi:MAG: DUF1580 domain-containing protein [Rhodopirellula sp.]|nr:DUF1580 domain-containing protein [Rhodopirellula sp.]
MAIDIVREPRISLSEAARREHVAPSTIWRWVMRGVLVPGRKERVRLESLTVRGRRYSTVPALDRFRAETVVADADPRPRALTSRRRLAIARRQARHSGL